MSNVPHIPPAVRSGLLTTLLALTLSAPAAVAVPFIWDQDDDHLDDRMETVQLLGYRFSFENGDSLLRQRIAVARGALGALYYSVYVRFDHPPGDADLDSLSNLGMPTLYRYEGVSAVRSVGTFLQADLAAKTIAGIERIEAIPVDYPQEREGAAAIAAYDPSDQVFPTWTGTGGGDGQGVVVAILDTGINDEAEGGYSGHESLAGRVLGGASFLSADSTLDTPRDGSENPSDHGGNATQSHGTHVAGIVLGTGGPSGYARGVAPEARAVDVKVLNDAGIGTGVAEAIDWCIHNRARDWGAPGYAGIQVINLSLSSLDESDGNDVASELARRAVELGIVVVASVGNEGKAHYVPSPAAGDKIIAVGAVDDQRSPLPTDDVFASFSDQGPRADDGDLDLADEQKPDLVAPGVAILSADGDLSTDGHQYKRLSGTSMAAAFVSGAVACMRSSDPGLPPARIADLLHATAWRWIAGLPAGDAGTDPRWQAARGYGMVDLYAAALEASQSGRSQVARLELVATESTKITATLRTQREHGAAFFALERAPDLGGVPGEFAGYDSVAAAGDSSLTRIINRTTYTRVWSVPSDERGQAFWYRVAYAEDGVRYLSPARRFVGPIGPSLATIEVTLVHNAYDHDVSAAVVVGDPKNPDLTLPLPGSSAAVASDWVSGLSATGNVSWTFRIQVPSGTAAGLLPPTPNRPWTLRVQEGGYLNRSGRVTSYELAYHWPPSETTYQGGPVPQQTVESGTVSVIVPSSTTGIGPETPVAGLRIGPNPARPGAEIRFVRAGAASSVVSIFDLGGRLLSRVPLTPAGDSASGVWRARDARGRALAPGLYLARLASGERFRIVILPR
ncbi:MAG TPA: S8 family serine peptidase [Candidatus Eisenbacteria bacterium]